jgi:hypothetical protein
MKLIDEELGGTTPLEVILKFPDSKNKDISTEDDEFEDWGDEGEENDEKYWFTKDKIDKIASVHNYLDSLTSNWKSSIFLFNYRSCNTTK